VRRPLAGLPRRQPRLPGVDARRQVDNRGGVAKSTRGDPATGQREKGTLKRAQDQVVNRREISPDRTSARRWQEDLEEQTGDGRSSRRMSGRPTTDHVTRRYTESKQFEV
jgi:hypothetical protein